MAALATALVVSPAAAQQGSIGGIVVNKDTQQPLTGAQVSIDGTGLGMLTAEDGRFVIRNVPGTQVTVRVTLLGYGTATRSARVGQMDLRIEMAETAVELDRIVVTGTPGGLQRRAIGNVVSTLNAEDVVAKAPVTTVSQLVNGRAAGVTVLASTGEVGGAAKIRIRGASSFSLSRTPLIYIDGVRVNNDETSGPANQSFGSSSISRWNDINPEDIASIEIIKGPAAATLYGTEAANGVIQIITKKGRQGAARFNLQIKQGANWFANPEGRLYTNWGMVNGQLESITYSQVQNAWKQAGGQNFFQTGHNQSYDLSVSGGNDLIQYFLSGGFRRNEGVESTNLVKQGNTRLNLTVTPDEHWQISGNFGYVNSRLDMACESGCGGVTWSTYFITPTKTGPPRYGLWSGTPDSYHALYRQWQDMDRFTGSFQIHNNVASFFSQRLTMGVDRTHEGNNDLMNHDERYIFFDSFADRGYRDSQDRLVTYTTLDYSGTAKLNLSPDLQSNTSVGAQYYRKHIDNVEAYGEAFPVPGLTSVDATTTNRTSYADFVNNTTVGVFAQQQFGWLNRRFLTLALRADDNSAFGENFNLVYYPKVSGAWVLSDEPFFHLGLVNTLRLRGAYGESGQQPVNFAAIRTFAPATGPNDVGTVTPQNVGNPDLGPERSREVELGFDAGLFNDRLGLELTYYNQQTRDAILLRQIAPSTGFSGSQYVNAGKIANNGLELALHGTPYTSDKVTWDLGFNVAVNNNKVLSLGNITTEDFIVPSSYVQDHIGYPVDSWFEKKIVSAQLDANGNAINVMCDGGPDNGHQPVACSSAPSVYLGRNQPKYDGGFNSTLTLFRNLRLYGQMDFKTGFSKLDGNERVRCFFFDLCRENYVPQDYNPVKIAGYQLGYAGILIHDASFAKLREISATYSLPAQWAARIGARTASITLAGRNLATWTKYTGLEPEATFNGGSRGGDHSLWEQDVLPQLATFVATINVSF